MAKKSSKGKRTKKAKVSKSAKKPTKSKSSSQMKCCPHCQDYKNCNEKEVCCEYCDHYFKGRCTYEEDLRWEQEMKEITTFGIDVDVYGDGSSADEDID